MLLRKKPAGLTKARWAIELPLDLAAERFEDVSAVYWQNRAFVNRDAV
jgi:hypothetical protein